MATLRWLEDTAFSDWVLTSTIGFPLMLSLHAVGMAIAVGLILVLDLRLLGAFDVISYSFLRRALVLSWTGFIINFFSGLALFVPRGIEYVGDPAFLSKIFLISLGVAATARLQGLLSRGSTVWDTGAPVRHGSQAWAVASIIIWFGAITSGRLIAYVDSWTI